ncbi:MAG: hypothetical protein IKL65_04865 [Bacilli bacterium]|nr:hypothetical protein [Bacilli bacterium]
MDNFDKKENILFKKLDLVFVYLFIFLVGIAIVLMMTSYLNNRVKEFNEETIAITQQNR